MLVSRASLIQGEETIQDVVTGKLPPPPRYKIDVVLDMLKDAVLFEKSGIVFDLVTVLASRFDEISVGNDLSFLSYGVFLRLVGHTAIALESEWKLYLVISKYIHQSKDIKMLSKGGTRNASYSSLYSDSANQSNASLPNDDDALTLAQTTELFGLINWEKLSIEELEEAIASEMVPKQVLIRGLITCLKSARGQGVSSIVRPMRKLKSILGAT